MFVCSDGLSSWVEVRHNGVGWLDEGVVWSVWVFLEVMEEKRDARSKILRCVFG